MPDDSEYEAEKAAARANREFYRAFESLDLAAMKRVWLDDERIRCVHPGWELLTGTERVFRSWELIFQNTAEIRFDVSDVDVQIVGSCAFVTAVENIRSSAQGSRIDARAAATNLFERTADGYRMVLHHASPIAQQGFDDAVEGLA